MSKNVIYLPKGEEKTVHPPIPPQPEPQVTALGRGDGVGRLFELLAIAAVAVIAVVVIVAFVGGVL